MIIMPASTWSEFKTLVASKSLSIQYLEYINRYELFADEANTYSWQYIIPIEDTQDISDFETNYKASANQPMHRASLLYDASNNGLTSTSIDNKQALDVSISNLNLYANIVGNITTVVKPAPGILVGLIINNNATGGDIVIYDNILAQGVVISALSIGTPSGGLLSTSGKPGPLLLSGLNLRFLTGLTIVTSGSLNNNITVLYR